MNKIRLISKCRTPSFPEEQNGRPKVLSSKEVFMYIYNLISSRINGGLLIIKKKKKYRKLNA